MKVLVTGVNGQLGHDVMLELNRRGHCPIGSGSGERCKAGDEVADMPYMQMDICSAEETERVFSEVHPDAVVH